MKEWIEAAKKYYERLTGSAAWTKEYRQGKAGLDLIAEIEQLEKIKEKADVLIKNATKPPSANLKEGEYVVYKINYIDLHNAIAEYEEKK